MKYFILRGLAAHHVDAAASLLYVGLPTMTAFHGLAWNFVRQLNELAGETPPIAAFLSQDEPAQLAEFAVAVSRFTLSAGLKRFTKSRPGATFNRQFHHSSVEARRGSLEFSFIVAIESAGDTARFTLEKAKESLVGLRLAGSTLELKRVRISSTDSRESALAELRGPIFVLRDASSQVLKARQEGVPLLEAFRSLIEYKTPDQKDTLQQGAQKDDFPEEPATVEPLLIVSPDISQEAASASVLEATIAESPPAPQGWHIPIAVGYRLLENPAVREGARQTRGAAPSRKAPHAFGESVLGVVRAQLAGSVRAELRRTGALPPVFWRPATLENGRLLLLSALCEEELEFNHLDKRDTDPVRNLTETTTI